jgi:hypothetical protein
MTVPLLYRLFLHQFTSSLDSLPTGFPCPPPNYHSPPISLSQSPFLSTSSSTRAHTVLFGHLVIAGSDNIARWRRKAVWVRVNQSPYHGPTNSSLKMKQRKSLTPWTSKETYEPDCRSEAPLCHQVTRCFASQSCPLSRSGRSLIIEKARSCDIVFRFKKFLPNVVTFDTPI